MILSEFKEKINASARWWDSQGNNSRQWWNTKQILDDIEIRIPFGGMYKWMGNVLNGRILNEGISIGCGSGHKELALLGSGHVNRIYGYEISEKRIEECKNGTSIHNLTDRFFPCYSDGTLPEDKKYDLVYWNNSLHHMVNVEDAVRWSYETLNEDGILYVDDYVGANQMQFTDKELELASGLRAEMPVEWFPSGQDPMWYNQRILSRPPLFHFTDTDPTEMKDCEAIIPSIHKYFPNAEIILTGGIFYWIAMVELWKFFDEERDRKITEYFLTKDKDFANDGYSCYAVCIVKKQR